MTHVVSANKMLLNDLMKKLPSHAKYDSKAKSKQIAQVVKKNVLLANKIDRKS